MKEKCRKITEDMMLILCPQKIKKNKEMNNNEKREYERELWKRKMNLHKKLGAEKFQKVVFAVEKAKYKVLKTICPNFLKYYSKWNDFHRNRQLKKATTAEERKRIIRKFNEEKLLMKKEFVREQNRNYHMNENNPTEFIKYLNWNKDIHIKGLQKDAVVIPLLGIGIVLGLSGLIPILIIELCSAAINWQCVNIQDYNIARYNYSEPMLRKLEERKVKKRNSEYTEGKELIGTLTQENERIPTIEEIVASIKTPEQAAQIRDWAKSLQKPKISSQTVEKAKK